MAEENRKVYSAAKNSKQKSRKMSDTLKKPVDFRSNIRKFETMIREEQEVPSSKREIMAKSIFGFIFGQN